MRKNSCSYPVKIVADAFGDSPALAEALADSSKVLLVADYNVAHRIEGLGSRIGRYFQAHGIHLAGAPVVLSGGEKVKSEGLKSVLELVTACINEKLGVNDTLLALGGGTVLDVAGYAAAQVRGGVRLVRVPTTPLAQFDAVFSPVSAVNVSTIKDGLVVTSTPSAAIIDPTLAASVLEGVWRSGAGAFLRQAVASDALLIKKIETLAPQYKQRDPAAYAELLEAIVAARQKKTVSDLCFWSANRLEALSAYCLPHGYALTIGILIDLALGARRGVLSTDEVGRIRDILVATGTSESLTQAQSLLKNADGVLCGLDAWLLSHPEGIPILAKLGKTGYLTDIDRETYRAAVEDVRGTSAVH